MFDHEQDTYKSLRSILAERTSSVVSWVGSGLSRAAGLPAWSEMRGRLEVAVENKSRTLEPRAAARLRSMLSEVRKANNPWIGFQILEEALGPASFRDTVRETLAPALEATPPKIYQLLWRLRVGGILNLNLDKLATRAHGIVRPGQPLNEFDGKNAGAHVHLLKAPQPFIANLHGTAEDASSWVWTAQQLRDLVANDGYKSFVGSCLATRTVIFVGITADDAAVGGHLERLARGGIDVGTHFWITHRTDLETDRWAEAIGIRIIRYTAPADDHSSLYELFDDLLGFVPKEPSSPPPVAIDGGGVRPEGPLPAPGDLATHSAEEIRRLLNARAADILAPQTENAYEEYARFRSMYDEAIYRAWYVTTAPPANTLMGYRLGEVIGEGAFGRVFGSIAPDGSSVAIKVLHEDVRHTPGMLESFRRGVRSMRILSERQVQGMVAYRVASEIPAFAVMELINGPNLKMAVESRYVDDWPTRIRIAVDLVKIIRAGHGLPERVLHRDIRPSNIMLKHYYADPHEWEVVVLDFDLSWHRGALEKSVAAPSASFGYLAPEQFQTIRGASTRNAAVDSFGLGMTLMFLCSGREPTPGIQQNDSWPDLLRGWVGVEECHEWRSAPARISRLIVNATRQIQSERWDMGQIEGELQRLRRAVVSPNDVESAELWAEEVAARCNFGGGYQWLEEKLTAEVNLGTGVALALHGNEPGNTVDIRVSWASVGAEDRKRLGKWLPKAADQAAAALRSSGWRIDTSSGSGGMIMVTGSVPIEGLTGDATRIRRAVTEAATILSRFE